MKRDDVDAVIIGTGWQTHVEISIAAMRAGKTVGCEVGGAITVEECFCLVNAYEKTKTSIMFLENCCFGREELAALHMVRQGILGDIVHYEDGYCHDCRFLMYEEPPEQNFRLTEARKRNCDCYPTHGTGSIAKILDINRGNRFVSLTSTASCAKGLKQYAVDKYNGEHPIANIEISQGDVVTTVIKCAGGETVTLTFTLTIPRWYSRCFQVCGTKGMFDENSKSIWLGIEDKDWEHGNMKTLLEKYDHPMWKRYVERGTHGEHEGMDGLMVDAFFAAIRENKPMPVDVYDMATLMAITPLTEQSILLGSAPVAFPDFTNGRWMFRSRDEEWDYSL